MGCSSCTVFCLVPVLLHLSMLVFCLFYSCSLFSFAPRFSPCSADPLGFALYRFVLVFVVLFGSRLCFVRFCSVLFSPVHFPVFRFGQFHGSLLFCNGLCSLVAGPSSAFSSRENQVLLDAWLDVSVKNLFWYLVWDAVCAVPTLLTGFVAPL